MKKIILNILIILNVLLAQAQTQKGTVRLLSSGKKPVSGVQVLYSEAKATESDAAGVFRLVFNGKKPGDLIFLERIHKQGYEVVNVKELEINKISNADYFQKDIVLAVAGTLETAKREYYHISDNALLASFEKEKQVLKAQLQQVKVSQQEYLKKYEELEKQYENQKKNLDALAEKFARTNFDEVSSYHQEALELFKAGKVQEAIHKLEGANLMAEAEKVIKEEKRLAALQQELEEQKAKTQTQKKHTIEALELNADIYVLRYETAKAGAIYEELLRLDNTNLDLIQKVANFYKDNHFYEKALNFYNQILNFPNVEEPEMADAYLAISQINTSIGKLKPEALEAINKSLKLYKKIVKEDQTNYYQQRLALAYEGLGDLYTALGYDNNQKDFFNFGVFSNIHLINNVHYYDKMTKILEKLFEANPHNISLKKKLALAYQKLGDLRAVSRLGFEESFSDIELMGLNQDYIQLVKNKKNELQNLYKALEYSETHKSPEEEKKINALKSKSGIGASNYYEKHRLDSIQQRKLMITEQLNTLKTDTIYKNEYYEKMHQLLKELYISSPKNLEYKNLFAHSYARMGNTYMYSRLWQKALEEYEKSYRVQNNLYQTHPHRLEFKRSLAIAYSNMAAAYIKLDSIDKALIFYQKRLDLAKELYADNSANLNFKTNCANSYAHLGIFYTAKAQKPDKAKAIANLQEAEKLLMELRQDAPKYEPTLKFLNRVNTELGFLLNRTLFTDFGFGWFETIDSGFYDGFIITKDSNKVEGSIFYDNPNTNQEEIKFKDKDGSEKIYAASVGEVIAFEFKGKQFELVSMELSSKKKTASEKPDLKFLRREFNGDYIKTYIIYNKREGRRRILKKKGGTVLFETLFGFKVKFMKYLNEYPELVKEVDDHVFGYGIYSINNFLHWYEYYRRTQK